MEGGGASWALAIGCWLVCACGCESENPSRKIRRFCIWLSACQSGRLELSPLGKRAPVIKNRGLGSLCVCVCAPRV